MHRFLRKANLHWRQAAVMAVLVIGWTAASAGDARLVYYDVAGHSARELRDDLNNKGPLDHGKRFDAHTAWRVTWTFLYAPEGNGCKVTKVNASLDGTIELPRWQHRGDASPTLVGKWERYLAALRVHEDGHYAHGVAAEREIDALGQSFRITGSCTAMAKAFNDEANAIVARYAAMDATYDRDTDHGRSQGAVFP